MMIAGRETKRLPGIRFEAQSPPLAETLPRMDIAVFVGFAASGPLHTPVVVESAAQFAAIFGEDAPLAWDKQQGEVLRAYLAPAVRAFFRNGGRRCWVVRVARDKTGGDPLNLARSNYFMIPGLARAVFSADGVTVAGITPAFAQARSEGSWSDGLRVSATVETRPLRITNSVQKTGDDFLIEIELASTDELTPGDMLRLTFEPGGEVLMLVVAKVKAIVASPPSRRRHVEVTARQSLRFEPLFHDSPLSSPIEEGVAVTATIYTRENPASPPSDGKQPEELIAGFARVCQAMLRLSPTAGNRNPVAQLELRSVSVADAPAPGSLVKVDVAGRELWLIVAEQGVGGSGDVSLRGEAVWLVEPSVPMPLSYPVGERLSFELWVRLEEKINSSLPDLTFAEAHNQFWCGSLPTDSQLFGDLGPDENPAIILRPRVGDLFRFPLAGFGGAGEVFFPLGMQTLPENYLGAITLAGTELERDGLANFDASIFLDGALADTQNDGLLPQADFIRYLSPRPRGLRGIHAALGIEEATIIAVPDAVHRGWAKKEPESPDPPAPSKLPLRPEWWHFLPCKSSPADKLRKLRDCDPLLVPTKEELRGIRRVHEPLWENFLDCSIEVIEPPKLSVDKQATRTGVFTLSWASSPPGAAFEYEVEEAATPDFGDAVTIYAGAATQLSIIGRQMGSYYYRVKAKAGRNFSDWSNGVLVRVIIVDRWELNEEGDYDAAKLLMIERATMRMCAARGDLFAVFSLPQHFREEETVAHLLELRSKQSFREEETVAHLLELRSKSTDFLDNRTLSFGAVWHPWLSGREENRFDEIRSAPPCGATAGVLAKRALARGAWVAPANEPLSGVVAIEPRMLREEWLNLQEAQLNLIRQEPRGFLSLGSDTLSDDPELRQINVRRLLSLLRRLALKHGATYVFEPNSLLFQRAVKRGFEAFLNQMFMRGAFAGETAATSYQVAVGESLNTTRGMELGRLIVELRFAPSLPLRFLTVRLVQTGDRGFTQEV